MMDNGFTSPFIRTSGAAEAERMSTGFQPGHHVQPSEQPTQKPQPLSRRQEEAEVTGLVGALCGQPEQVEQSYSEGRPQEAEAAENVSSQHHKNVTAACGKTV